MVRLLRLWSVQDRPEGPGQEWLVLHSYRVPSVPLLS
ncbi:hypothetical protein FQN60_012486 [Etheostoma spectabile]|uniref:Uncharacterized protein n=1 Tax=Etheostoma spectabile TaxID=54343 RepID=A0A5J5DQ45_9PERO|nr:hypothetical protein FQN60_012486 [Etheostoma spectabile]